MFNSAEIQPQCKLQCVLREKYGHCPAETASVDLLDSYIC